MSIGVLLENLASVLADIPPILFIHLAIPLKIRSKISPGVLLGITIRISADILSSISPEISTCSPSGVKELLKEILVISSGIFAGSVPHVTATLAILKSNKQSDYF